MKKYLLQDFDITITIKQSFKLKRWMSVFFLILFFCFCTTSYSQRTFPGGDPLCGDYTIGGEGADFLNFNDAIAALDSLGISCPVVFNVRDGLYNEQIQIDSIPGTSEEDTVIFQSESGDSTKVSVSFAGDYVILLSHVHFLTLSEMTILNVGGSAVMMTGQAGDIRIRHCKISVVSNEAPAIAADTGCTSITILANYIIASLGTGVVATSVDSISFADNVLSGATVSVANSDHVTFTGNDIRLYTKFSSSGSHGVTVVDNHFDNGSRIESSGDTNLLISGNRIVNVVNGSGILLNSPSAMVVNNFVHISGNVSSAGIKAGTGASGSNIIFNSIHVTNTNWGSRAFDLSGGDNYTVKNNIFCNREGGYAAYVNASVSGNDWDYNDYYSAYNNIGYRDGVTYHTLAEWCDIINGDMHSLVANPFYSSDTNLSVNQILLNNAGIPVENILYDIDSTLRNPATPDIGAKEFAPCSPDAGITAIMAPANLIIPGLQPVTVVLQNQGTATFSSATIGWEVNGIVQLPYSWNGLLEESMSTEVTLDSYDFLPGTLYDLKIWSENPDGEEDCNPFNDTTEASNFGTPLCGEYTIGGMDADFQNFTDAVTLLNIAGLSCPVIFKIRNGYYNEQIAFDSIPGVSETNTVTFESESGDSSAVVLLFQPLPDNNYIILLNKTQYLIFKKISITAGQQTDIIRVTEGSGHFEVSNCIISSSGRGLKAEPGSHDIAILSNRISSLDTCLSVASSSHITVEGNVCNNVGALSIKSSGDISIKHNTINNSGSIICEACTNVVLSENENMNTDNADAIVLSSPDALIANNFVSVMGEVSHAGILLKDGASGTKVIYNSVQITNINPESTAFSMTGGDGYTIENNIFSNAGGGYAVTVTSPPGVSQWDYNDYYTVSGNLGSLYGTVYYTLATWSEAIDGDTHSLDVDPLYVSDSDLRPYQRFINGAAITVADILTDIDGETRNPLKPDIGADEFYIDFGVAEILNPGLQCEHDQLDSVTALVKQYADIPFVDLALAYRLNAGKAVTETVPGYTYDDLTYTFDAPADLTAYGDYLITVFLVDAHDDNPSNDTLTAILYSYPPPIIDFDYHYCGGATVHFGGQATATPPYTIDSYEWDFGDSTTASGTGPSHIYLQSGTYRVNLKVYLNTGCYNEITSDVTVDVTSTEMVMNLISDDESCSGLCDGQIHAMVKGGTPPYTYTLNGETMAQSDMTGLCPGQYILEVNDLMDCLLADTVVIKTITDIHASFEADTTTGYAPLTIHFHFTGTPGYNLKWDFGDDTYSSEQDPTHIYETGGSYLVMLIVYSDTPGYCADTTYLAIGVSNAVNIRIYNVITPNGDGMNDYFEVDSEGLQTMTVTIFDRRGLNIYKINDIHGRWDGRTVNGDQAGTGTYFYILHAKGFDGKDYKKEGVITLLR